jgi:hypothetical protein
MGAPRRGGSFSIVLGRHGADGEGAALRGRCRVVPAVGGFPLAVGGLTQRSTISWLYSSQENSKITAN